MLNYYDSIKYNILWDVGYFHWYPFDAMNRSSICENFSFLEWVKVELSSTLNVIHVAMRQYLEFYASSFLFTIAMFDDAMECLYVI